MSHLRLVVLVSLCIFSACSTPEGAGGPECGPGKPCKPGLVCDPKSSLCVTRGSGETDAATVDAPSPPPDAPTAADAKATPDATPASDAPPGVPETILETKVPSFIFRSEPSGATFECRLDDGGFAACNSPRAYPDLAEGTHTFEVRAVNGAVVDPTPANATFTIDHSPPDTTITTAPAGEIHVTEAAFAFTCSEPPCVYECRIDDEDFTVCQPGVVAGGLTPGAHVFRVRAMDAAGNTDPSPAEATFSVRLLTAAVVFTRKPAARDNHDTATFGFVCFENSGEVPCVFTCALDGGPAAACTSEQIVSDLDDGGHQITIAGTLGGGQIALPASYTWWVDATLPVVTITEGPTGDELTGRAVSFSFSADEPVRGFGCVLDAAPIDCTAITDLGPGQHAFSVTATDLTGNTSLPAMATFVVDAAGPDVTVTAPLGTTAPDGTLTFSYTDASGSATFTCNQVTCGPSFPFTDLADGENTITIVGTDAFGNVSTTRVVLDVDAVDPLVSISGPPGGTVVCGSVTVSFDAVPADDVVTYTCALDDGAPAPCSEPSVTLPLSGGTHTVRVRAVDAVGNVSAEQMVAVVSDDVAPVVFIGAPSLDEVTCADGAIDYDVTDEVSADPGNVALVTCELVPDDGDPVPCAEGPAYEGLTTQLTGSWQLRMVVEDSCGNASMVAQRDFNVDTVAPAVTITEPSEVGACSTGAIGFSVAGGTFTGATLDGEAVDVAAGYGGLDDSPHVLAIHAIDACGNAGTGNRTFSVDSTGPTMTGTLEATSGAENTGAFSLSFAANPDVAAVEGGVVLDTQLGPSFVPTCTCEADSCSCGGLAAGTNHVYVRGVDACGNAGAHLATTATSTWGPYEGHLALIGYDFSSPTASRLLGNAVALMPVIHKGLVGQTGRQDARVLSWGFPTTNVANALFTEVYGAGIGSSQISTFNSFSDLDERLPGHDVLLINHISSSQSDASLDAIAAEWAPTLTDFLAAGGVVIALDGSNGTTPGKTWRLLAPILDVTGATARPAARHALEKSTVSSSFPSSVTGVAPFRLAQGLAESWSSPHGTCFDVEDDEAAVVFEHAGFQCPANDPETCGSTSGGSPLCPIVVYKLFPTFRVATTVTPVQAPDPDPTDTLCNPDVLPATTGRYGGGTNALEDIMGDDPPSPSFICLLGEVSIGHTTGRPLQKCQTNGAEQTFSYTANGAWLGQTSTVHADVTLLIDGEPVRTGREDFHADRTVVITTPLAQTACQPKWSVQEEGPSRCYPNLAFPYKTVSCKLQQDLGGGNYVDVGGDYSRTDAGCGAVADSRGGFASNTQVQITWPLPPTGTYRTIIVVDDYYGNSATALALGCVRP